MKIRNFLVVVITFLVLTFSYSSFSLITNDIQAASISINSLEDGDYIYERVFVDGIWWIYVYENGVLVEVFPEDE